MSAVSNLIARLRQKLARPPREIALFFVTSISARGVGIVCQMLQVPLVVTKLGPEAFGLWMTMTSMTNFVLFADFGVGLGVQNKVAEAFAHNRRDAARALFSSAFAFMSVVAVILAVLLSLVAHQLDYASLFHLHETDTIADAPAAIQTFLLIFCAGFPFGLAQRLAFGRQVGWMYNTTQALGSVLALGSVFVATRHGAGLTTIIACAQGSILFGNVVLLASQFVQLHWLDPRRFEIHPRLVRELLGLGAWFGVQQVLNTILFSLPPLLISTALGAAAVTPYNLLQRLYNLFAVIQNAFMLPLWPAYARARARGEFSWMRRALRHSLAATAGFSVTPMFIGACFAPMIIHLWVGHAAVQPPPALVWLLFAWNALVFFQQPFGYLLAGVSEVRRTTIYSICSAVTSATLMVLLVHAFGVAGVLIGLIAGYVPFNFVGNVIETGRYLRAATNRQPSSPSIESMNPVVI